MENNKIKYMKFKSNISKEINLFGLNWKKKKEIYNKIDKKIMKSIFFRGRRNFHYSSPDKEKKKVGRLSPVLFFVLFVVGPAIVIDAN